MMVDSSILVAFERLSATSPVRALYMYSTTDTPVSLRRIAIVGLAVQWNLPLWLLLWYPWPIVQLIIAGNCFLWALGGLLAGHFPRLRDILSPPRPEGSQPRGIVLAIWMAALGSGVLVDWYFEYM
jgi:hypothetical protein